MSLESDFVSQDILSSNQDKESGEYHGVKLTLFRDPKTGIQHEILGKYSPNLIADNVLNYLDKAGYANLLFIGASGSGKSTFSNQIVHLLHTKRSFNVNWHTRDDVQNFTKIINDLPKGVNTIEIFDDVSFSLEELGSNELAEIYKRLTYVRHIVKANVVIIFNMHYTKAIGKFLRVAPFVFLTSIANEELDSFQKLFGAYSKYKLTDFSRYYSNQMLRDGWQIKLDEWDNRYLNFKTDHPFRLAISNEITGLHYTVFLRDDCSVCRNPENEISELANPKDLIDSLEKKYGSKIPQVIKYYAHFNHGKKILDSNKQAIVNTIALAEKSNHYNWDQILEEVEIKFKKHIRRSYVKKSDVKEVIDEINNSVKDKAKIESSDIQNESL